MLRATRLRCFPREDEEFAVIVGDLAASIWPAPMDPAVAADLVADRLRQQYPEIRIAVRSSLAGFTDGDVVWYVYRDGDVLGRDGKDLGAMRFRTPDEQRDRRVVETIVVASRLMARSRALAASARAAVDAAGATLR